MSVLQGMFYGLIPIISKVSGCSEIVTHEDNSLVLNNHLDTEQLAALMERLIVDTEASQRISDRARETAVNFTWTKTLSTVLSAYKNVLTTNKINN
jgi:glycosyltransferase involved in cell wall biosynthesis